MKIRYKFITGLTFILLVSMLVMNVAIRNVLNSNMEKSINNSLKQVMNSTHEHVKYKLVTNGSKDKKEALVEEGSYIIKYISLNYQCKCDITDMNGKFIEGNAPEEFRSMMKASNEGARQGKAIVDLKYENDGVIAMLTYPLYVEDEYAGIISIVKDYNEEYATYAKTLKLVNVIEFAIFIAIFMFSFLMTTRITKPVSKLTDAVKEMGNGDYDISIDEQGKDEVAILAREFKNMRDKIKEQIETIEAEKDKVYKLEKARREFFNSVTHELKTPLTAISGYAELMLSGMVKDKEFDKRAAERICSESDRLHNLVLELMDVSKGMCVIKEEFKEVNMKELVAQSCNDMRMKAGKYSLNIVQNISEGTVRAQEDKIRQVMINLLDNAIKYSCGGNEICVDSHVKDHKYFVEVTNNSRPIPDETFSNIFEPFVRCNNGDDKESRGLGLYLCNEIMKEHDGEIAMENGPVIRTRISLPMLVKN